MQTRRWRQGPGATCRRREPRQFGGVFHPLFGQRRSCSDHETDAALAAAIAATAHRLDVLRRDLDELPAFITTSEKLVRERGDSAIGAQPASKQIEHVVQVSPAAGRGAWWSAFLFAVFLGLPATVRAVLRAAAATGLERWALDSLIKAKEGRGGEVFNASELTPLRFAVKASHHSVADVLLQAGADPNLAPPAGPSHLALALSDGKDDAAMVKLLLDHGACVRAELVLAAQLRAVESLRVLLAAGADANRPDENGRRPLSAAMPSTTEDAQTTRKVVHCVELLLEAGASPSLSNPIATAASFGLADVVAMLLRRGDGKRTAALTNAMGTSLCAQHADIVRMLLDHGATLDLPFALRQAAEQPSGEVTEAVLEHAAAVFRDASARHRASLSRVAGDFLERAVDKGWTAAIFRRVLAPHRDWFPVDALSDQGATALQRAVTRGQIPMVRALLDIGADPAAKARDGKTTALIFAQWKVDAATEGSVERRMAEGVLRLLQPPS